MGKRKRRKLTKAERELVWGRPTANAGAGWESPYRSPTDGVRFEREGSYPSADFLDDPEKIASRN